MIRLVRSVAAVRPRHAAGIVLALGLVVFGTLGFQVLGGDAANVPSPGARLSVLDQRASAPLVVYSEFGYDADTIWAANPDDPNDRTSIAQITHAYAYGVIPVLSPDGSNLAVAVLPPGVREADGKNAELHVIDVNSGRSTVLASDIDLSAPVWSPASDAVVARRVRLTTGAFGKTELVRVTLDGAATNVMQADGQLFPVDFSRDGSQVYAATISANGTDLSVALASGGGVRAIAHLSDDVARDWDLSPDGNRLAYVAEAQASGATMVAWTLELSSGAKREALPGRGEAQLSPKWEDSGGLTIGVAGAGGGATRIGADGSALRAAAFAGTGGFDLPLDWSPDGERLAVRGFANASLADPGASWVYVLDANGNRRKLAENSDVIVAGWLNAGGTAR
jgi:Tol biopolymer transport system component